MPIKAPDGSQRRHRLYKTFLSLEGRGIFVSMYLSCLIGRLILSISVFGDMVGRMMKLCLYHMDPNHLDLSLSMFEARD